MRPTPPIATFLNESRFAVLATINPDGSPQQTVMWFELQDDEIMMNTARGRQKDQNLLREQRASICVEDGYRYVTISGSIALDDDPIQSQNDIKRLATRYHGSERAEAMMAESFSGQQRVTLRLAIVRIDPHGFDES